MEKKKILKEVADYAILIVIAVLLAFLMNRYVYANAEVPTGSMMPQVIPEDRLIVNRLSYVFSSPKRGDVVMFKSPDDESEDFLKRIIGLPGEKIDIVGGYIYINDSKEPLKEPYLNDEPNGDYGPFFVPEGHYFMLGDNRDISDDARFWNNKYVMKEKIVGKAIFRYYPNLTVFKSPVYGEE